jgi:hypothetical protein
MRKSLALLFSANRQEAKVCYLNMVRPSGNVNKDFNLYVAMNEDKENWQLSVLSAKAMKGKVVVFDMKGDLFHSEEMYITRGQNKIPLPNLNDHLDKVILVAVYLDGQLAYMQKIKNAALLAAI